MPEFVRNFTYVRMSEEPSAKHNGWRLNGMPNFDPCFATHVVLHDAFEHHPTDLPDMKHEMMAFGATFLIRVRGKWDRPNWQGKEHESNASDIGGFLEREGWKIEPCDYPINEDAAEHIAKIKHEIMQTYSLQKGSPADVCIDNAMAWLSVGYVRALFRWKGAKPRAVCSMIENIGKNIDIHERKHNDGFGFFNPRLPHGSTLSITFNTDTLEASIKMLSKSSTGLTRMLDRL